LPPDGATVCAAPFTTGAWLAVCGRPVSAGVAAPDGAATLVRFSGEVLVATVTSATTSTIAATAAATHSEPDTRLAPRRANYLSEPSRTSRRNEYSRALIYARWALSAAPPWPPSMFSQYRTSWPCSL